MNTDARARPGALLTAVGAGLIAACGGGGGGGSSPPTPPPPSTYSVSGSVTVPLGTAVDSDVNDPGAPFAPNDDVATAQAIPNPAIVGGYVNEPGAGSDGRLKQSGDASDLYLVELLGGQRVSLLVADSDAADADLYLWDSQAQRVIDASVGAGPVESLDVPANGRYLVEVRIYSGATNYVLSLGQVSAASEGAPLRVAEEFVPGEVAVHWRGGGSTTPRGLQQRAGRNSGERLYALESLPEWSRGAARLGARPPRARGQGRAAAPPAEAVRWETLAAVKALRRRPDVAHAEPNYLRRALLRPNDRYYDLQWHYSLVNLPAAWDVTVGDDAVIVAVIDSGVLLAHPDLQGQLVPGYDFIRDPELALDGDGIDADPDDPGDGGSAGSIFHGTHVAGTLGAATNNGVGVAGVAWNVSLMPLRVLGLGGVGTSYDIRQAIRYAAGLPNDSGRLPARRADVINLSLGGPSFSAADQAVIDEARAQGVAIVAAAGNEASTRPVYPAAYAGVIATSAVAIDRSLAPYSSFGNFVDLAAPGGGLTDLNGDGYPDGVLSAWADDGLGGLRFSYAFLQGTSMAAPHVAGVLALMKSVNPALTPIALDNLLLLGELTAPLGSTVPSQQFGYGLIDARRAVAAALDNVGVPQQPVLAANPRSLSIAAAVSSVDISLRNAGGGQLQVTDVSASQSWLGVTPLETGADGLGTYRLTVSRTGLTAGTYSAVVTASSTANAVTVPVLMQVGSAATAGDAGLVYVLLVDTAADETAGQDAVLPGSAPYSYRISGVDAGVYALFAGTDMDGDGFICDAGEACGAYLTLDGPIELSIDGSRSQLDFAAGFGAAVGAAGGRPVGAPLPQSKKLAR